MQGTFEIEGETYYNIQFQIGSKSFACVLVHQAARWFGSKADGYAKNGLWGSLLGGSIYIIEVLQERKGGPFPYDNPEYCRQVNIKELKRVLSQIKGFEQHGKERMKKFLEKMKKLHDSKKAALNKIQEAKNRISLYNCLIGQGKERIDFWEKEYCANIEAIAIKHEYSEIKAKID